MKSRNRTYTIILAALLVLCLALNACNRNKSISTTKNDSTPDISISAGVSDANINILPEDRITPGLANDVNTENDPTPDTSISAGVSDINNNILPEDRVTPEPANDTNIDYYMKLYDSLITEWKSALSNAMNGGNPYSENLVFDFYYMGDPGSVKAYYALYDIDGNGIPELILRKETMGDSEGIIAYIFTIKDDIAVNVFGYYDGKPSQVPWSRYGSSTILSNGLIDSRYGDYSIYKIADDGCTAVAIARYEPYDYENEASLADAKWRYYVNTTQVDYNAYVQYLNTQGYTIGGNNTLAIINWIDIEPAQERWNQVGS